MAKEQLLSSIEVLHEYLETSIKYGEQEKRKRRNDKPEIEVIPVKITVTNTADKSLKGADIVFMGVNLSFQNSTPNTINTTLRRWIRECKISRTYGSQDIQLDNTGDRMDISGEAFPPVTSDERRHGEVLFPGDSIEYEIFMPMKHKDDGHFEVSATISRRHLFHCHRVIESN